MRQINKEEYRKKGNIVIVAFLLAFACSAIAFSTLLIALFGKTEIVEGESTGNFVWNLLGVVIAFISTLSIMNQIKTHRYFDELLYVWKLKQTHLKIYRKLNILKNAAHNEHNEHNEKAITILKFYYQTQQQVFELDNNTLTIKSVLNELERIRQWEESHRVLNVSDFQDAWLNDF
ncbi:TPA: DUF3087 domain-containing protein [Vibrio vulnificus]|uniref:DUF3087 family protein n=1 Tax=Vibrio vulnificus TaxID=672 RepID=UPI0005F25D14|nr:DUF3087 family protein [Vibrio vulnificus]MCA3915801.1 DUF3087 domain-containing protein [Vibrio vulnificus]MCG6313320.1 DUF3087 domain-containing protein [Vibrio vulnificus]HAS6363343.1 DUF3087 family protein [Vibrio vulnificus]HDY7544074.1 DUF3087 domain-containing protein [Vibrio vulnificus]HDY7685017.1 DUF3087 domain-containing protein [Vibrio vulnificus]